MQLFVVEVTVEYKIQRKRPEWLSKEDICFEISIWSCMVHGELADLGPQSTCTNLSQPITFRQIRVKTSKKKKRLEKEHVSFRFEKCVRLD